MHLTWYHGDWKPEGAEDYGKSVGRAVRRAGAAAGCWPTTARASCSCSTAPSPSRPPQTIPNSIGHWAEWTEACKIARADDLQLRLLRRLAEAVLLGNVSYRAGGKKLDWDAEALKATNCPEADAFIQREYRAGWTL